MIGLVELHSPGIDRAALAALAVAFPQVAIDHVATARRQALVDEVWLEDDFDFWRFDRAIDALADAGQPLAISASPTHALAIARQVLTRAQRRLARTNAASRVPWFERVLADHRALHDLAEPRVLAAYDLAVDAWQWSLRRDAEAPAAAQLAALCHTLALDDLHAQAGASRVATLCASAGVPADIAAAALRQCDTRSDAAALAFFSLASPGYLASHGAAQTAAQVAATLASMTPAARGELAALRLPRTVRTLVASQS